MALTSNRASSLTEYFPLLFSKVDKSHSQTRIYRSSATHKGIMSEQTHCKLKISLSQIAFNTPHLLNFPGGSGNRESTYICLQCRRPEFNPWVGKTPWRREWLPTPVFWPENSMDREAWRVVCPWGCNELDATKQLIHTVKSTEYLSCALPQNTLAYSWAMSSNTKPIS